MKIRMVHSFFLIVISSYSFAQNQHWEYTNFPYAGLPQYKSEIDTLSDIAYIGGTTFLTGMGNVPSLVSFNGSEWTLESLFGGNIMAMVQYQGKLYVGGSFTSIDNVSYSYLARYDGSSWDSIPGISGPVTALEVIEDTLYIGGSFEANETFQFNRLMKYDGDSFIHMMNNPFEESEGWIQSFANYQNNIYIGGNFDIDVGNDLIMFSNNQWHQVGDGLSGFATTIRDLEVFQDELYAAGTINASEGNVGNFVQKWNGETWSQVGLGLHNGSSSGQILSMDQHGGALYVCGNFSNAGEAIVNDIARWDGNEWCGLYFEPDNQFYIGGFFFQGNTIHVRFDEIPGHPFFNLNGEMYKWIGGEGYGPCAGITSVNFINDDNNLISVWPNPSTDIFYLSTEVKFDQLNLFDLGGKLVFQRSINASMTSFDLSTINEGVYILQCISKEYVVSRKIVKL